MFLSEVGFMRSNVSGSVAESSTTRAAARTVDAPGTLRLPRPSDLTNPPVIAFQSPTGRKERMRQMTTTHITIDTTLGELTLVAENGTLCGVYFPGHWTRPDPATFGERVEGGFEESERQLNEYLAGERTSFDLPTAAAGDEFSRRVWERLKRIPYGRTVTYGEIATELGNPTLARRVGGAVAHNPLSIVVPCHRVVGRDGKLTGYAGGLERKRFLLELEQADGMLRLAS
jgi:methylated-DNA-[protein]-cysteine S-methyltransferase